MVSNISPFNRGSSSLITNGSRRPYPLLFQIFQFSFFFLLAWASPLFSLDALAAKTSVQQSRTELLRTKDYDPPLPEPTPTAVPPKLGTKTKMEPSGCRRQARQDERLYQIDSLADRDARGLSALFKDSPAALSELQAYRTNRSWINATAYTSTIGILVAVSGPILSRYFGNPATGNLYRTATLVGGLSLTGTSLLTGWLVSLRNEGHLSEAVKIYNQQFPNQPVQLEFTTGFDLY